MSIRQTSTTEKTPRPFLHRLYYLASGIQTDEILNAGPEASSNTARIDFELKQAINFLKHDAIQDDAVDYSSLKNSEAYLSYRNASRRLRNFDLNSLDTKAEKMAFWINLYNVLIVDAVIHYGIQHSVREVRGFFARAAYVVAGYRFSADDIEHGILRANAGHIAIPGPQFNSNDPRRQFIIQEIDPRLHFTLVCASQSCPPVGVYDAQRLDEQLNMAAHNFINGGEVQVDLAKRSVSLSQIFQWYAPDFGGNRLNQAGLGDKSAVLRYIAPFIADPEAKTALAQSPEQFNIHYNRYNWGLNLTPASATTI